MFTGDIEDLWAKTDENGNITEGLLDHMRAVGATAEKLLKDSIYCDITKDLSTWLGVSETETIALVKYLAAMHDIGKAHPMFQRIALELPAEFADDRAITTYRHELGSEEIASRIWTAVGLFDEKTLAFFAFSLRLHHQRRNKGAWFSENKNWRILQDEVEKEIRAWSGVKPMSIDGDADAACTLITAIIIICDWMASSGDTEGAFRGMRLQRAQVLKADSFKTMFGFEERTIQKEIVEHLDTLDEMPLLAIIEAPMGEGKTEAGMYLAFKMAEYWGKNGLYFALPTTATSNQMVERVERVVGEETQRIHASSWLIEEDTEMLDEEVRREYLKWKAPRKRALFARFGVGTVDQVMTTVLRVRYGILRLLGLTNKVVIIDELHSYDAYMSAIISRLVDWCVDLKIPVVMLSATLPKQRKAEMLKTDKLDETSYPLVTEVFDDGKVKELPVRSVYKRSKIKIEYTDTIPTIPEEGCVAIIANTVNEAVKIYSNLDVPEDEKMLFHSRFTVARRQELEKSVIRLFGKGGDRPKRMVLVATQVIEQSLDVDFDLMFTELAPIDLVLQRIGRLHRHEIKRPKGLENPRCVIYADGLGTGRYIYYELLLQRSKKILETTTEITIPEDIPHLVGMVYSDEPDEELIEQFLEKQMDTQIQKGAAKSAVLARPDHEYFGLYDNSEFEEDESDVVYAVTGTRYGEDAVQFCMVPERLYNRLKGEKHIGAKLAKQVFAYCVSASKKYLEVIKTNEHFSGEGRLFGCQIIKSLRGERPTDTLIGNGMTVDRELGLIENRKGENIV